MLLSAFLLLRVDGTTSGQTTRAPGGFAFSPRWARNSSAICPCRALEEGCERPRGCPDRLQESPASRRYGYPSSGRAGRGRIEEAAIKGPQTKGLLLVPIVADILQFLREGRISREDLEADLGPDVLKLLDTEISPISWYDGDIYPRLARFLMKIEGRGPGDMSYLRQRGERAGRRLVESGLYQQLDYMKRRADEQKGAPVDRKLFEQTLRLINSVAAAFMKGGTWTVEQDPDHDDRVQFVVTGVAGMAEENAQATCGILTGITMSGRGGFSWLYERPAPDRLVYRMDRDISGLGYGGDVGQPRVRDPDRGA